MVEALLTFPKDNDDGSPTFQSGIINIANNEYSTDLDSSQNLLVNKKFFKNLLITIQNSGNSSGLSYEISGSIAEDVPTGVTDQWSVLPSGEGTVDANVIEGNTVTDVWSWILIRFKKSVSGAGNTTCKVNMRANNR